jgi:hypothetical protein
MPVDYKSRLKSLAWRVSMMILAVGLDWGLQNVGILVPTQYTVLAGLVLGEISKAINNEYQYRKELSEL